MDISALHVGGLGLISNRHVVIARRRIESLFARGRTRNPFASSYRFCAQVSAADSGQTSSRYLARALRAFRHHRSSDQPACSRASSRKTSRRKIVSRHGSGRPRKTVARLGGNHRCQSKLDRFRSCVLDSLCRRSHHHGLAAHDRVPFPPRRRCHRRSLPGARPFTLRGCAHQTARESSQVSKKSRKIHAATGSSPDSCWPGRASWISFHPALRPILLLMSCRACWASYRLTTSTTTCSISVLCRTIEEAQNTWPGMDVLSVQTDETISTPLPGAHSARRSLKLSGGSS